MWAAGRMAWLPGTAYTPGGGKGPGGRTLGVVQADAATSREARSLSPAGRGS